MPTGTTLRHWPSTSASVSGIGAMRDSSSFNGPPTERRTWMVRDSKSRSLHSSAIASPVRRPAKVPAANMARHGETSASSGMAR